MFSRSEAERLLRQTDWLRELAYSILGDAHQAEDVAQEACLVALRHPPRGADEGGRRAWLAVVARNLARARLRRDGRRAERERIAARDERAASVAETVERVAVQRALVDAVLALDGLDRDVVVLRYFEGLPPREVAQRLGLTGAAVRSRLSRALAKLRARLESEHGVDAPALALVAAERAIRATPTLTQWLGGLLVTTTAKLALGAAAALVALVYFGSGFDRGALQAPSIADVAAPSDPEPLEAIAAGTPRREAPETEVDERGSDASLPDRDDAAPATDDPGERVVVQARIVDGAGAPLADAMLTAVDLVDPVSARSGADGRVRLEIPWPMELARGNHHWAVVEASRPGWTRLWHQESVVGPAVLELGDLQLEPGGAVAGHVVDARGAPLAGAAVYFVGGTEPGNAALEEQRRVRGRPFAWLGSNGWTTSETDGSYRIEGVPARPISIVGRSGGTYTAYTPPVEVPRGGEVTAPDLVLRPVADGNTIRGVVLDTDGPLAGVEVAAFENHGARNGGARATSYSNAEGRFELLVLSDAVHTLVASPAELRGFEVVLHDVHAGDQGVRMTFPERRWIDVDLVDPGGEPVRAARLLVHEEESGHVLAPDQEMRPEGGARLALPALPFRLAVRAEGYEPALVGPYDPETVSDRVVVDLVRARAVRGRVTAGGTPVAGARVHAHRPPTRTTLARFDDGLYSRWDSHYGQAMSIETDEDGRFELPLTGESRFLVHAEAAGYARAEAGPFDLAAGGSQEDVELRLSTGAVLTGRVRVAEGVPLEGTIVAVTRADGHAEIALAGADGVYRFESLAPGEWQVRRGTPENQEWLRDSRVYPVYGEDVEIPVDVELREGTTTHHDLDFTHEVPCTLSGRIAMDGAWEAGWTVWLSCGQHRASGTVGAGGAFALTVLGPGGGGVTFTSPTSTGGRQTLSRGLTLAPGESALDWSLSTGAIELTNLPVPLPSEGEPSGYALVNEEAGGGTWIRTFDPDDQGRWSCERVPAGTVELVRRPSENSTDPSSWPALGTLAVTAGGRTTFAPPGER